MSTTSQIAVAVRDLLATPESWTKGEEARDASGRPVPYHDPRAVCFCLMGAVRRVCGGYRGPNLSQDSWEFLQALRQETGSVTSWNDNPFRTHKDVLKLLERFHNEEPAP